MAWTKTTFPDVTKLVSIAQAKKHIGLPSSDDSDDDRILDMLDAAYTMGEEYCKRVFLQATVTEFHDDFQAEFLLSAQPAISVTSVEYFENSTQVTVASTNYDQGTDVISTPARLRPNDGFDWPTPDIRPNSVKLTYEAGSTAINRVDPRVRQAILLTVGNWNENRESVSVGNLKELPLSATNLLDSLWTGHG